MFIKALLFQNPGMFKGVMQKVNPFRSASQVGTASSVPYSLAPLMLDNISQAGLKKPVF